MSSQAEKGRVARGHRPLTRIVYRYVHTYVRGVMYVSSYEGYWIDAIARRDEWYKYKSPRLSGCIDMLPFFEEARAML